MRFYNNPFSSENGPDLVDCDAVNMLMLIEEEFKQLMAPITIEEV